jgi:peptidoglycan L-alanyl-D-glutamate endopeptidase CwlK
VDKLSLVHPILADRVRQLFSKLKEQGYDFLVTQGLRTWAAQNALYAQGRTTAGPIITNAPGGHSQHNFGLAVDVVPRDSSGLDWNVQHPAWKAMLVLAPAFKLAEGAQWRSFPDNPHLYPSELPSTCDVLREKYTFGGMPGVWAWFESLVGVKQ